jgi:hypothetical protein
MKNKKLVAELEMALVLAKRNGSHKLVALLEAAIAKAKGDT